MALSDKEWKALEEALNGGGYNAAPEPLTQGSGNFSATPPIEVATGLPVWVGPFLPPTGYEIIGRCAPEPAKKPECECGARKTSKTPDYAPGHSTWCPVAEDEETLET